MQLRFVGSSKSNNQDQYDFTKNTEYLPIPTCTGIYNKILKKNKNAKMLANKFSKMFTNKL